MGSSRNSFQYNSFQTKVGSNPIAHRVRRKRQRLPPNLLIENASDRVPLRCESLLPEAFPIKPSDPPDTNREVRRSGRSLCAAKHRARVTVTARIDTISPLTT